MPEKRAAIVEVGRQVTARAFDLGITTQAKLAEAAGVGDNAVAGLIRGYTWPQRRNQRKLELALEWPAGTLEGLLRGDTPIRESTVQRREPSLLGVVRSFVRGATICLSVLDGRTDQRSRDASAAIMESAYELEMMLAAALPDAGATFDDTKDAIGELHAMRA